ncbi:efflux RND transporter periplasmic adaptor subunit [Actinoplanes sp. NPDC051494]|uniref:efflux RND transporter periplasmic adaptor subunit n=1 Tax=Actinoplanes sp. NPDC051494 TaxID=3363907 RepID=UPI0037AE6512
MPATPEAATEIIPRITEPPPRRRRTLRWLVAGLVVAALGAGATVAVTRHRAAGAPQPEGPPPVATAQLERRDLSTTKKIAGSIGYGAPRPLAGHLDATVTWLPAAGATIKRGKQLFRADDRPVTLFYGSMPMYREISGKNLVGRDVRIIADNLTALGYAIGSQPWEGSYVTQNKPGAPPPDPSPSSSPPGAAPTTVQVRVRDGEGVLTASLVAAIKRWQDDTGLPATGTIAVGDVEVLSGAVRVDSVAVQPGSPANADLMAVTPTRKVITLNAELSDAGSIKRGAKVTVALPDDRTVKARVLSVGRKLATSEDGAGTGPPTLTVTVTADEPKDIAGLDAADVDVNFAGRTAKDVLAAPIEALVALTEGGYAVQTPAGLTAVRTGMFADGWVEIEGDGLAEGTDVVVSS